MTPFSVSAAVIHSVVVAKRCDCSFALLINEILLVNWIFSLRRIEEYWPDERSRSDTRPVLILASLSSSVRIPIELRARRSSCKEEEEVEKSRSLQYIKATFPLLLCVFLDRFTLAIFVQLSA